MAGHDPGSEQIFSKTERRVLVVYYPKGDTRSTQQVNITGKWLAEMDFEVGRKITVKIDQGCLLLTAGS